MAYVLHRGLLDCRMYIHGGCEFVLGNPNFNAVLETYVWGYRLFFDS